MRVPSTDIQAYKAIVIVAIVVIGSPVVKKQFSRLWTYLKHADKKEPEGSTSTTEDV
jgi:simple sugar transport system permease protein